MLHEAFLIIIMIIVIMEIFNVLVIQIYKQNHCSLVYNQILDLAFNNVKPNDWYFVLDLV